MTGLRPSVGLLWLVTRALRGFFYARGPRLAMVVFRVAGR
jgi:hypothetical protein